MDTARKSASPFSSLFAGSEAEVKGKHHFNNGI
jgi:hypothetical protein